MSSKLVGIRRRRLASPHARRGGAWINLIAAILAISVLIVLVLPAMTFSICGNRRIECSNKVRGISMNIFIYEDAHRRLPGTANGSWDRRKMAGYVPKLFSYLGESELQKAWREGQRTTKHLDSLVCPVSSKDPWVALQSKGDALSYVVNGGICDVRGLSDDQIRASGVCFDQFTDSRRKLFVTSKYIAANDGLAQTLLVSENLDADHWGVNDPIQAQNLNSFVWWPGHEPAEVHTNARSTQTAAMDSTILRARPSSNHEHGVNAAFCDGHGQFIDSGIDYDVYRQMMTSNSKLWLASSPSP